MWVASKEARLIMLLALDREFPEARYTIGHKIYVDMLSLMPLLSDEAYSNRRGKKQTHTQIHLSLFTFFVVWAILFC